MDQRDSFHFVTLGTSGRLARYLWDRIAVRGGYRISHIAHPTFDRSTWPEPAVIDNVHFLREPGPLSLPAPDRALLASLEQASGVTVHNMILGDRLVLRLPYEQALAYSTFLAQRYVELYRLLQPSAFIGGFDALHGSLAFAVARLMNIPWFAPYFSSMPSGQVSFCSTLTPDSMVDLGGNRHSDVRPHAEKLLCDYEGRQVQAVAYIPPPLFSPSFVLGQIPHQLGTFARVLSRRKHREQLKYTEPESYYSLTGVLSEALRLRRNLWGMHRRDLARAPVPGPYAFFGFHMQPESSIDVFAHFFANQMRVVELMSRSLPPTHTLMVKLHKSDAPNYSAEQLTQLAAFPGVRIVSPYADTRRLIEGADLIFAIQGTIGLEGALLGKPVIMFGESAVKPFPSVSTVGKAIDLPQLVRDKLTEQKPTREAILAGLVTYLLPFYPASGNDWTVIPTDAEIDGYVRLFSLLQSYVGQVRQR